MCFAHTAFFVALSYTNIKLFLTFILKLICLNTFAALVYINNIF